MQPPRFVALPPPAGERLEMRITAAVASVRPVVVCACLRSITSNRASYNSFIAGNDRRCMPAPCPHTQLTPRSRQAAHEPVPAAHAGRTNDDMKLQLEIAALGQHAYLSDRIKILLYDPHGLSVGTPLEGRGDILEGNDVVATKADILRALILNHYDGIYVDFDSVFLQVNSFELVCAVTVQFVMDSSQSLCPLLSIEWAYQWKYPKAAETQLWMKKVK
jgi:hypothetical protein